MSTKLLFDKRLPELGKYLKKVKHVVVITDTTVNKLYSKQFPKADVIVIGEGEGIKNLNTVYYIIMKLLEIGADRQSLIVGIGGGIVCDIAGFTASIYMRGLRFGFVPTTLLAQVDACLGGKNGVNFEYYKNIVGVIRQPEFIYYDLNVLKTLPERELKCGFAESLKHSIISGKALDQSSLKNIVKDSIRTKLNVVKDDVQDRNKRHVLNLGHTIGHAIEAVSNGRISHGEAVAIGVCFSARYSASLGLLNKKELDQIIGMFVSFRLPTELPNTLSKAKIIEAVTKDKKKVQRAIDFVLIKGMGKVTLKKISINKVGEAINALC